MATSDTMSFPDYDPVTGQPTFDGWTGNTDPGVATTLAESGFAVADRLTFAGGSLFPPVGFQCEKITNPSGQPAGHYVAFSFFCTFDVSFDTEDVVVIDVLATPGDATTARRITIFPNTTGVGAGDAGGGTDSLPG